MTPEDELEMHRQTREYCRQQADQLQRKANLYASQVEREDALIRSLERRIEEAR